jgi:hypothetical protein
VLTGLAGTAALAGMGAAVMVEGAAIPRSFADRLVADLAGIVPGDLADTRFTVTGFQDLSDPRSGQVTLRAQVRMDWRPGMRQRRFEGRGKDPETAYAALRETARDGFAPALAGARG